MISFAEKKYTKEEVFKRLNPLVKEWFNSTFENLTPSQSYGLIPIFEEKNVLISSPTGTGKTLTGFLSIISKLLTLSEKGELENRVYCIYISPLRALSNDIYRNLETPLRGIVEIAERKGVKLQEIRHAVRTGDTSQYERQKMLRKTPHILITTPESLSIIINAKRFREKLKNVKWVIVDEIHSLCENKRGTHLALTLERLQNWCNKKFVRIGLSATIHPLKEIAEFLVGYENGKPRDCLIIDVNYIKQKEIRVFTPVKDLVFEDPEKTTEKMYEKIMELVKRHRTTLIFTNTRSGTERVVFHLKKMLKDQIEEITEEEVAAHHGSLSRYVRFDTEKKLKEGRLRAIVSSTSLELGIDIGYIDLVIQIGSPKSVTRCLQRIGRSGHALHEKTKGIMICMDLDDLVEVAVMVKEAYANHLDKTMIPEKPLDVLAQHILGMAINKKWTVEEALKLIRQSYPYRNLAMEELVQVLKYLSGGHTDFEDRKVYGKIWFDEEEGVFGRRGKFARVIYSLNIGVIPDEVMIKVYDENGKYVGNIEEEFLQRLIKGDRFILGGKVYEFMSARGARAKVKPAFSSKPTVPSWFSEQLPLSFDLALKIGEFREKMFSFIKEKKEKAEIIRYIMENCRTDENSAESIHRYFETQYLFLKSLKVNCLPTHRNILIEEFTDEKGRKNMVFHTLYGRRVNEALSRACAYLVGEKIRRNIGLTVTDNGFSLIIPGKNAPNPLEQLTPKNIREILGKAIRKTELMKRKFRHCAVRSLMILRNYKGHEIRVSRQQINANTLLRISEEIPGFPVLKETYREIMEDDMDVKNAVRVLEKIRKGEIKIARIETPVPSPFAHNIVLVGLSDVVLMEDRKEALKRLYGEIIKKIGVKTMYKPTEQG